MFKNYIVTIFRNLTRNKLSSLINISGLAVSIACCIVIYVFIRHEKTFDHFHKRADQIHRIVFEETNAEGTAHGGFSPFPMARALRADFPALETVTQLYVRNYALVRTAEEAGKGQLFEENEMTYADEYFLGTFDFPVLAGNKTKLLSSPDEVILTERLAKKFFGSNVAYHSLIGNRILVNKQVFRISAILKDIPRNSNIAFNMLLPFKHYEQTNPAAVINWRGGYSESYTFVTLPKGMSSEQFDAALLTFRNKYLEPQYAKTTTYHAQPLKEVHTDELYGGTLYATPGILVVAFIIMGAIVLLTACINFINLATAQSLKRAKEIGVRKTLGSSKWQLMARFMGETLVLNIVAAMIAIALADWFLDAFNNYMSFVVDFNLHISSDVIIFLFLLLILVTFLAGFYPAKIMSSYQPILALKSAIRARNTGFSNLFSLRKALVIVQFVVTQLLIIGTVVVATQMNYFYNKETGYRKEGMLTVEMPSNDIQKLTRFRTLLMTQGDVQNITFSSGPPTSASNGFSSVRLPSGAASDNFTIERKFVDNHYLKTFEIELIAGRDLMQGDSVRLGEEVNRYNVLINKKAALKLGFATPTAAIGKPILLNDKEYATVVGVTADFSNASLQQQAGPCLMFYGLNWISFAGIHVNNANDAAVNRHIKQSWESVYPDNIFKSGTLDEYIRNKAFYIIEDVMYKGFRIFVVIAIIIGCMGLYGLVAFLAAQRQKEIGIRKVLGASVRGIVYLFSREFTWLITIAFIIAAPLGYLSMQAWLQTFANRIELHPGYFIAAFLMSLLVAGVTISFQSVKAAVANPIKSLRSE
ncbi:MAG: FtsX-like permease family protein [Chitinophagaceae bacterium]|nr:MAG: FtsX-like permease family protein [Chitinophagaceae bacterium]